MNILVTGAHGFIGKNLCVTLENIKNGKDKRYPALKIEEVFEYDVSTPTELLDDYCANSDFVFNLAGVNRPIDQEDFLKGNYGFASVLLDTLKQ